MDEPGKVSKTKVAKLVEQLAELRTDSRNGPLLDYFDKYADEIVKQEHDSRSILTSSRGFITLEMLNAYPYSPTIQRYREAFKMYTVGSFILHKYSKQGVESQEDCEHLQLAFHNYALALMCEVSLFCQFYPPNETHKLVDQYLRLRPNDVLAEYFKVTLIITPCLDKTADDKYMDFELQKLIIRTLEEFVLKLESKTELTMEKRILTDILYQLGATYSVTNQALRSLHSFKKSYAVDQTNTRALYAIAYNYLTMLKHLDEAETMFLKFIESVPVCDNQFPNAHFSLAQIYICNKNIDKAATYYTLGEKAEENRIPFLKKNKELPQKLIVKAALEIADKFK